MNIKDSKSCSFCNSIFYKKFNISRNNWIKSKFCSNICQRKGRNFPRELIKMKGKHNSPLTEFKKGTKPWNFGKGNGYLDSNGYKIISIEGIEVKEHHLVWCSNPYNLPYVPKGFVIHHLDGNKLNNNIDNLSLILWGDHSKLHNLKSTSG